MTLTKGLIKADIIAAGQAIDYYDKTGNKSIKNIAAYHIQQATEKLIKYQIYRSEVAISNSQMYTHNIERLIVYGEALGIDLIIPDYIMRNTLKITEWEAGSRYDIGFSVRIDVLKKAYKDIVDWVDSVD